MNQFKYIILIERFQAYTKSSSARGENKTTKNTIFIKYY